MTVVEISTINANKQSTSLFTVICFRVFALLLFSRKDEVGNRMFSRVHNMNLISAADLIRRKRLLRICSSLAKWLISTAS